MTKTVYDLIKKQNGEKFAQTIRTYHNGIFEVPAIVDIVRYAGRDAEPIKEYLGSLIKISVAQQEVHMDPIKLLRKAGYYAYVVNTLEEQNAIKGYFRYGEKLCTFGDPDRFKKYYIINAIKMECLGDDKLPKSEWHIQPSKYPEREDKYGTSVISIQILKKGGFISIKNRYNHHVESPDHTFNSNPDNIINGLSDALKYYFKVSFKSSKYNIPGKFIVVGNKIVSYNEEFKNMYIGDFYYVKDGQITEINKQTQLMLPEGLILDMQNKTVTSALNRNDELAEALTNEIADKKIQITKNENGDKTLLADGKVVFVIKKRNNRLQYETLNLTTPAEQINFSGEHFNIREHFDFTTVKNLNLRYYDDHNCFGLGDTNIKFNPNAESIRLHDIEYLHGNFDFSNVKKLEISRHTFYSARDNKINLIGANIKFNPNAELIHFENVINVNLDILSTAKNIILVNIESLRGTKLNPNAESIELRSIEYLPNKLDFSNVNKIILGNSSVWIRRDSNDFNLTGTEIKFNPNAELISLETNGICGAFDFSGVKRLNAKGLQFDRYDSQGYHPKWITIKFNPNADFIDLSETYGLRGKLDFRNVKELNLLKADITCVKEIIVGPETKIKHDFGFFDRRKIKIAKPAETTPKISTFQAIKNKILGHDKSK